MGIPVLVWHRDQRCGVCPYVSGHAGAVFRLGLCFILCESIQVPVWHRDKMCGCQPRLRPCRCSIPARTILHFVCAIHASTCMAPGQKVWVSYAGTVFRLGSLSAWLRCQHCTHMLERLPFVK